METLKYQGMAEFNMKEIGRENDDSNELYLRNALDSSEQLKSYGIGCFNGYRECRFIKNPSN